MSRSHQTISRQFVSRRLDRLAVVVALAGWMICVVSTVGFGQGETPSDTGAKSTTTTPADAKSSSRETTGSKQGPGASDEEPASKEKDPGVEKSGSEKGEKKAKKETPKPPEARKVPYRVLISLAFAPDSQVSQASVSRLKRDVATVLERVIGETWSSEVEINDWLFPATQTGLDRLAADEVRGRYQETNLDRVMLVSVSRTGARFEIAGRPFNVTTRTLSLSRSTVEFDRRALPASICRMVRDMFEPTVEITVGGAKEVEVQLRAGEYPIADPDSEQMQKGVLLEPFLRYRDRKTRKVERIQPLTWTYIRVLERKRAMVRCEVATALRNPLQGGGRGVELMAVGIDPVLPATRLSLLPRRNPSRPLIGHRVVVLPRRLTKKAASTAAPDEGTREGKEDKQRRVELPPPRRLLSDRAGQIAVTVDPGMPLVWMYVMSGNNVLARVPFVPGREHETALLLPDDSDRLGVEGHVTRLQGELIETVARRAVHMALAKKMAEAEPPDWTRVDKHIKGIEALPTLRSFEEQLEAIEFPAVQSALADGNRVAANRIKKLCTEARALFNRHLDEAKLRDFRSKIDDIRKTAPAKANQSASKAASGN